MSEEAKKESAESDSVQEGAPGSTDPGDEFTTDGFTNGLNFDFNLIADRAMAVVKNPSAAWQEIKAEDKSISELYQTYFIYLAAIPAIGSLIGSILTGYFAFGLKRAIVLYLVGLSFLYISAMIVEKLAPTCGGQADTISGFKLVAFSQVPSYLAGVFSALPISFIGFIGSILSLYSLKVLWDGIPIMTGVPNENRLKFLGFMALAGFAVALIFGAIFGPYLFASLVPTY